jgi:hypothetical protein
MVFNRELQDPGDDLDAQPQEHVDGPLSLPYPNLMVL